MEPPHQLSQDSVDDPVRHYWTSTPPVWPGSGSSRDPTHHSEKPRYPGQPVDDYYEEEESSTDEQAPWPGDSSAAAVPDPNTVVAPQPTWHAQDSTDQPVGDYWINKPSKWLGRSTSCAPTHHAEEPRHPGPPSDASGEEEKESPIRKQAPWPGASSAGTAATAADDDTPQAAPAQQQKLLLLLLHTADRPRAADAAAENDGSQTRAYPRAAIGLQLGTLAAYLRARRLQQPLRWDCCACATRQAYRSGGGGLAVAATVAPPPPPAGEEIARLLRCRNPRCGVSDRGFRLYRVHELCGGCTVLVDRRAPVTVEGLRRKRAEVRAVLGKVKGIYEDVGRLLACDAQEAENMARLVEEREAKEVLDRERREEEDLRQAEMERWGRDARTDGDGEEDDALTQDEDGVYISEEVESGEDEYDEDDTGKPQKKKRSGWLKGLFGP